MKLQWLSALSLLSATLSDSASALTIDKPSNVTSLQAIYEDWPPPSARSLLGPTGYKTKVYVQYYVDRYPHPVTDGEGHSIEDCLLQANRMILAQRDPFQARRIRIEEQENLGEKTAVVIFRHGPRRVIPTELVGRAMMKLYNMVHQYESVKQWRGLRFGSIYLRDETDRLLGYIAWDLENQP